MGKMVWSRAALVAGACIYLLLSSCMTVNKSLPPPLADATKASMDSYLQSKDATKAFAAWSYAKIQQTLPGDYLGTYRDGLDSLLQSALDKTKTDDNAEKRILAHENVFAFDAYQKDQEAGKTQAALFDSYDAEIKGLIDKGMPQIAVMFGIDHPDYLAARPDTALTLEKQAQQVGNPWAVSALTSIAAGNGVPANQPQSAIDPQKILRACVTVWVDRGLKMESGVGLPDRVIGSAFFVEKSGYLITNYHVISSLVDPEYKGFSRLFIRLGNEATEKIPAKVVGWDPIFDLALLKTEIDAPAVLPLSDLDTAPAGTRVLAFGSPGGLESSVTAGIISNQSRKYLPMGTISQIDAPVNPGNSGGPLTDEQGRFLGIVFAGIPEFQGVNFVVPAYWVAQSLFRLASGGLLPRPFLGVQVFEYRGTLRISYVAPGSPAYLVGMRAGDQLETMGDIPLGSTDQAYRIFAKIPVGALVSLTWKPGDGKLLDPMDATVKSLSALLVASERPKHPLEDSARSGFSEKMVSSLFGMSVQRTSVSDLFLDYRVLEVIPGSPADEASFAVGDNFRALNWVYDPKAMVAYLQMNVERRAQGFFSQTLQLAEYIDSPDFL